ncbi:hypothetical protein [Luteibacter sp. E-22]|uniref:hypothetical protein n=1 Tax=Luteibacter sp. E-22 TaxID=3404050 RepID=UPI003CEE9F8B
MKKPLRSLVLALLVTAPIAVSAQGPQGIPLHCSITRTQTFERFIATKPTPEQFRAAYGCIQLQLPNSFSTHERRVDNSRYFALLDEQGRIVGGRFG